MSAVPAIIGLGLVVLGFVFRLHPLRVVAVAMCAAAVAAGVELPALLAIIGEAFRKNRFLVLFVLVLPVIGSLERAGLREQAHAVVLRLQRLTVPRLLVAYLALRQLSAALGLVSLGGQAQTVRPLLAPMAEAAAFATSAAPSAERERLRALCAATDNVALFFGEDLFVAFGAVLLMQGFLAEQGIALEPLHIALWGIPTAACAFSVHALRVSRWRTDSAFDTERR